MSLPAVRAFMPRAARSARGLLVSSTARSVLAALLSLVALAAGCGREDHQPVAQVHFVSTEPGAARLYTLADETRPALATPMEHRVQLTAPSGSGEHFAFLVPHDIASNTLVATGIFQRAKRVYPIAPQVLTADVDTAGVRTATMVLPVLARGAGPATALTLVLTIPPAESVVETSVEAVTIPAAASLEVAYALSDAADVPGAVPVRLSVTARVEDEDASHEDEAGSREEGAFPPEHTPGKVARVEDRTLWSTVLRPKAIESRRWQEVRIDLGSLAERRAGFVFRAEATSGAASATPGASPDAPLEGAHADAPGPATPPRPEGRRMLFPLWADPTIVALAPRPPMRRNVILISLDTLRADRVGAYGAYRPTTPALDALAAESVVFTNAWAPWPETSGSHMSLFTSRYPSEHGVTSFITAPSASLELLGERLRRERYTTQAFTEDGGVWAHAGFARGFDAYLERRSPDFVYRGEAAATFGDAARWTEGHADRSFFLFVHTYQVHAPYAPPPAYRALFADIPGREGAGFSWNALNYDRETRFTDDQIGAFVTMLRRRGLAERSIVIVTSDHGEEFGEHGGTGHGRSLHREVLQIPLLVWAPGLLQPARIATPVSLLDVAPTVLELLGLAADPEHRGASLAPLMKEAAPRGGHEAAAANPLVGRPIFGEVDRFDRKHIRLVSVRRQGGTAITDLTDGSTRCYAADDPLEQRPSAPSQAAGSDDVCAALAAAIAEHRQATRLVGGSAPAGSHDPRLMEKMRALGYIE